MVLGLCDENQMEIWQDVGASKDPQVFIPFRTPVGITRQHRSYLIRRKAPLITIELRPLCASMWGTNKQSRNCHAPPTTEVLYSASHSVSSSIYLQEHR